MPAGSHPHTRLVPTAAVRTDHDIRPVLAGDTAAADDSPLPRLAVGGIQGHHNHPVFHSWNGSHQPVVAAHNNHRPVAEPADNIHPGTVGTGMENRRMMHPEKGSGRHRRAAAEVGSCSIGLEGLRLVARMGRSKECQQRIWCRLMGTLRMHLLGEHPRGRNHCVAAVAVVVAGIGGGQLVEGKSSKVVAREVYKRGVEGHRNSRCLTLLRFVF